MAQTVKVKSGDTMSALAKKAGVSLKAFIAANPQITNPNLIRPGQVLNVPGATPAAPAAPAAAAPTSGPIPGFVPSTKFPAGPRNPGGVGNVGPFLPIEEEAVVAPVTPTWTKAGTVQTANGPIDVDANGLAADGSKPVAAAAPSNPLNTGPTVAQVDSIAAIKALLSSYGIGELGDAVTNAVIKGYSADTIDLIMQDPNSNDPLAVAFQTRFSANKARAAAGKSVLSPGAYLALERQYTETMRSFGVAGLAKQETLSSFISNDVSPTEVADRVGLAVTRIQNADPETKKALAQYYPMLSQTDIVTSFLDPKEGLPALQRKVTMAEIGGAGLVQGMNVAQSTAADLADYGVTKDEARKGYATVAELTPRADFLSQISQGENYGQTEAEAEVFKGTASAKRARQSLTAIEQARFQGSAGTGKGSLGTTRQGQF
jgi:hypothetical protein